MANVARAGGGRDVLIDGLRAAGSQTIVLHHLAYYGPLSDIAMDAIPTAIDFLYIYGRWAVQIFFVLGGFFAARALDRAEDLGFAEVLRGTWRRYVRLVVPYAVVLVFAIAANHVADRGMDHESISAPPTPGSLLAHLLLIHKQSGYESLTAGSWYLSIDLQLTALSFATAALCRGAVRRAPLAGRCSAATCEGLVLLGLGATSLLVWNRDEALENWAIYFVGSWWLGMTAARVRHGTLPAGFAVAAGIVLAAALGIEWRPRLLLSGVVAVLVGLPLPAAWRTAAGPFAAGLSYLARISYSLFLIHFPVCLLVNAFLSERMTGRPWGAVGGMLLAWGLSLPAAMLLHHAVEAGGWRRVFAKRGEAVAP